jgi:hypothetical protein
MKPAKFLSLRSRQTAVIAALAFISIASSFTVVEMHRYKLERAKTRLSTVLANLKAIDFASEVWASESSNIGKGYTLNRSNLDGTGGGCAYIKWPNGPVEGIYSVSRYEEGAKFEHGSFIPMTAVQLQSTCTSNPLSCGF